MNFSTLSRVTHSDWWRGSVDEHLTAKAFVEAAVTEKLDQYGYSAFIERNKTFCDKYLVADAAFMDGKSAPNSLSSREKDEIVAVAKAAKAIQGRFKRLDMTDGPADEAGKDVGALAGTSGCKEDIPVVEGFKAPSVLQNSSSELGYDEIALEVLKMAGKSTDAAMAEVRPTSPISADI